MKIHIRRPMILIFLCVFFGTLIFRPLILKPYEKERAAFLTLYANKEDSCIVTGTVEDIIAGADQTVLVLKDCTISGYSEYEARDCGGVRLYVDSDRTYACGYKVRAYGGLTVFMEAQNPGQFDAYEYYRREHIYANVYAEKVYTVATDVDAVRNALVTLKLKFKKSFEVLYPEDEAGVIYAMVTGDKSLLTDDIKSDFKMAGISHILAVSGLHISFICLGFLKILKFLTVPKKARDTLTCLMTLLFVLFTGAGISVIRAGLMCVCTLLAENTGKKYDLLSALCFAGTVELIIYPLEGLSASFLLSYIAIIGVYAALKVNAGIFSGFVITLYTLPVTLYFYYEMSTYGAVSSILVIPVTGAALGFALFSGIFGMVNITLGLFPAGTAYVLVKWMEWVSRISQKLPFSTVTVGQPTIPGIIIYYVSLSWAMWSIARFREEIRDIKLMKKYKKSIEKAALQKLCKMLAVTGLICLLAVIIRIPEKGVTFLSVGQGDGIVYHDRETVTFDCGSSTESQVSTYILAPFLKRMGVNVIDLAIVSHMDSDHTSGIMEILESMPVYKGKFRFLAGYNGDIAIRRLALPVVSDWSEDYEEMVALAQEKNVEILFIEQGDEITLSHADLKCLWPKDAAESDNSTSIVCLLATKDKAYLMTGDATTESEAAIISAYPDGLRPLAFSLGYSPSEYILKVGHHGSKTSTGIDFLKWGDFDTAVISVGHYNTYGHPKQEILDRLEEEGIEVHRTDEEGAVNY